MSTTADPGALRRNSLKGLLWMDFQRHREGFLIGLPSIAFVAVVIGLVENAGGPMFFWMGLAMGVGCGLGFGRGEWVQGVEEFSLGLPPTRSDRYYVRYALGVFFLVCMYLLGLAAGPLGWIRSLGELSGLDLPNYRPDAPIWEAYNGPGFYYLSIGLSLAVFSELYALSINIERRDDVLWLARLVPFVVGALVVIGVDSRFFQGNVGYLTGFLGLAYAAWRTRRGARTFERKDVVLDGPEPGGPRQERRAFQVLVVLIGLAVLASLAVWVHYSRSSSS